MSMTIYPINYVGVVLTEEDIRKFLRKYDKVNHLRDEESLLKGFDKNELYFSEKEFVGCDNSRFMVEKLDEEDNGYIDYRPLIYDGSYNTSQDMSRVEPSYCIFITDVFNILFSKELNSVEKIKESAKEKLHQYLPNDFDWDEKIGVIAYTVFG